MNMRRPPGISMIEPGIGARLDCQKPILPLIIRDAASGSDKIWVQRRIVLIHRMAIATGGVGLPDFHERIRYWSLLFVDHSADDDDALTQRLFTAVRVAREISFSRLQFDVLKQ